MGYGKETWLIKEGVLTGRLHDAHSASVLKEALTGNSRAQNYSCTPLVRMTNTFMAAGTDNPEDMIKGVADGIYVYQVAGGTGMSTFTIAPTLCYRIRDGKPAEPLRVNVITGSGFHRWSDDSRQIAYHKLRRGSHERKISAACHLFRQGFAFYCKRGTGPHL